MSDGSFFRCDLTLINKDIKIDIIIGHLGPKGKHNTCQRDHNRYNSDPRISFIKDNNKYKNCIEKILSPIINYMICSFLPFNADKKFLSDECEDKNQFCSYWAAVGECSKNSNYMLPNCAKSCEQCGSGKKIIYFLEIFL